MSGVDRYDIVDLQEQIRDLRWQLGNERAARRNLLGIMKYMFSDDISTMSSLVWCEKFRERLNTEWLGD